MERFEKLIYAAAYISWGIVIVELIVLF